MATPTVNTHVPVTPGKYDPENEANFRRLVQSGLSTLQTAVGGAVAAASLPNSGVTAGTYGSGTQTPVIAVDAQGIITSASNVASGGGGGAVSSVFTRTGAVVATSGDYTVAQVTGAAPLASPALTGVPTAPTPLTADNSTTVATTAYVKNVTSGGYVDTSTNQSVSGVKTFINQIGVDSGFAYGVTDVNDTNLTVTIQNPFIVINSLTAARTITLPAISGTQMNFLVIDPKQLVTATNTISFIPNGAPSGDTINGASATTVGMNAAGQMVTLESDANGHWTMVTTSDGVPATPSWPFTSLFPSGAIVHMTGTTVTLTNATSAVIITGTPSYPTITLPAASVPQRIFIVWAAGTWGVAMGSQAQLTPNGTDTINGSNAAGKPIIGVGYGSCDVWTLGDGTWTAITAGYQNINQAANQVVLGTPKFSSAVLSTSTVTGGQGVTAGGASGTLPAPFNVQNTGGAVLFEVTNTTSGVTGIIDRYNDSATVGAGVPAMLAKVDLTGQSAAITATTLYATGSGGFQITSGQFRISWSAIVTQASDGTSILGGTNGFQITFTDNDTAATATTVAGPTSSANTVGTQLNGVVVVNAKTNTNIQYLMDYHSVFTTTTMKYALHMKLELLG